MKSRIIIFFLLITGFTHAQSRIELKNPSSINCFGQNDILQIQNIVSQNDVVFIGENHSFNSLNDSILFEFINISSQSNDTINLVFEYPPSLEYLLELYLKYNDSLIFNSDFGKEPDRIKTIQLLKNLSDCSPKKNIIIRGIDQESLKEYEDLTAISLNEIIMNKIDGIPLIKLKEMPSYFVRIYQETRRNSFSITKKQKLNNLFIRAVANKSKDSLVIQSILKSDYEIFYRIAKSYIQGMSNEIKIIKQSEVSMKYLSKRENFMFENFTELFKNKIRNQRTIISAGRIHCLLSIETGSSFESLACKLRKNKLKIFSTIIFYSEETEIDENYYDESLIKLLANSNKKVSKNCNLNLYLTHKNKSINCFIYRK